MIARYESTCQALQDLLEDLAGGPVRGAPDPPTAEARSARTQARRDG